MRKQFLFTSESVTEGHPDKMADQISDAILDNALTHDKNSRVACETLLTTGLIICSGEMRTNAMIDFQDIVRNTVKEIGYDHHNKGFDYKTCSVMVSVGKQSSDIAMGVDAGSDKEQGAGDQGMMFGYATDETDVLMPMPIYLSHLLTQQLALVRKTEKIPYLRPDGKAQVTIHYENNIPQYLDCVVISTQHADGIPQAQIRNDIIEHVIKKVIPENLMSEKTVYHINPTGNFVIGGPMGDCGLTGRKIIVDTYGGMGRHGGGAFSGKDPSKVDRSAAYAARYIAKNIVAAKLAKECEVQISYAIGVSRPVSVSLNTFGTENVDVDKLERVVTELFPLSPLWIVQKFDLLRPIYRNTAAYGHFGRNNADFTWEKTDAAQDLRNALDA